VLPVVKNGQALPESDINSADTLYNALRAAYNSGSNQRRTGAAFIYNTMMANRAPGTGRTVSNAQWLDLRDRLRGLDAAGKIRWHGNVSATINSFWQGTDGGFSPDSTTNDDAFYHNAKNEPGIIIRDYNNNVVYEILRRCANPVERPTSPVPPPQNYTLTPRVDTVSPTQIESGGKVTVRTSVDNTGTVVSRATQWEITQINVQPGKKAPHEDEGATASSTAPCQTGGGAASGNYFQSADATCRNLEKGSGVFNRGTPAQNLKPFVQDREVGDLPVGTRVCFALSIQPRSNTDNNWGHSKPLCTIVGKKPKVQIWGGDISVRGKIETSTSVKKIDGTDKIFGSWVEYGAFSVGVNTHFASGAGLNDQTNEDQAVWSKLTFANKNETDDNAFGNYTALGNFRSAPGIAAYFGAAQNKQPVGGTSVDVSSLTFPTTGPVQVRTVGDLTITGGAIPAGRSVVIISTGTVTIDGDITYADAVLGAARDIPQVVIIAANINIKDSVSRVDSWLVASGTINTCYNFAGNLTSNKCGALLEVNGPVVTNRLLLNRTAGSDTGAQSGEPAERFNLRPDAFLWAQLQASGNNKAQTVHSVELPPRF
jgi:hypothetical protein